MQHSPQGRGPVAELKDALFDLARVSVLRTQGQPLCKHHGKVIPSPAVRSFRQTECVHLGVAVDEQKDQATLQVKEPACCFCGKQQGIRSFLASLHKT